MSVQNEGQRVVEPYGNAEEGISLVELLQIFKQRYKWFLLGLVVVVGLSIAYLQVAIPQYESEVSVLVDPIQKSSSIENMLEGSMNSTKISTEVELVTSRKNIGYALDSLDLSSYSDPEGIPYTREQVLVGIKNKIVVTTVKDTNIVKITVTDQNPAFARDFANALASSYDNLLTGIAKNSKTAQREFIASQIPINDAALEKASDALGDFRENSDIIQLTDKSSLLVNEIAYNKLQLEPLKLQLQDSTVFIENYNKGLKDAGIEGVLSIDEIRNDSVIRKSLDELSGWKTELTMYESLSSSQFSGTGGATPSDASAARIFHLQSAIDEATKELLDRVTYLTRGYSNEANTQAIVQFLTTEVSIKVLEDRGESFVEELSQLPVLERQLAKLERDVQIYEATGLKLRDMLEEVKLVEAAVSGNVTVVDEANLPLDPVSPNKVLILVVALLLGCAVGLLLALAAETLDSSIRNDQQIKKIAGPDVPILGWIPMMHISSKDTYPTLAVFNDPLSFESERFKVISNMLYNRDGKRVFSITSCFMAEGKSTIVGNIALSLAQMGSRVLLIDGDLRLPSMERFFHLKHREVGLVDHVVHGIPLDQCLVQPLETVSNLHLLPPGSTPLVPSAIFSNPLYIKSLESLKTIYDFIIIDAPPLDSASELLSISKHVDGLIITVRAGVTAKGSLMALMDNLHTGQAPVAGIVLNGCIPGSSNGTYGYRYGSYASSYTSRYASYGGVAGKSSRSKRRDSKRKSSAWYRRRYKRDLKQRGFQKYTSKDAPLAFGEGASYPSISEWVNGQHYNPVTGVNFERNTEIDDTLSELEQDKGAIGKTES